MILDFITVLAFILLLFLKVLILLHDSMPPGAVST